MDPITVGIVVCLSACFGAIAGYGATGVFVDDEKEIQVRAKIASENERKRLEEKFVERSEPEIQKKLRKLRDVQRTDYAEKAKALVPAIVEQVLERAGETYFDIFIQDKFPEVDRNGQLALFICNELVRGLGERGLNSGLGWQSVEVGRSVRVTW